MRSRQHLYEYAIIRIVPRVEREEFVNAGVIVYSKSEDFLQCRTVMNEQKLHCLFEDVDMEQVRESLSAFEQIAAGKQCDSPIARLDAAVRFRWLTAVRSTIIQCSKVHPGRGDVLEALTDRLFEAFVL